MTVASFGSINIPKMVAICRTDDADRIAGKVDQCRPALRPVFSNNQS
jgi:hypothetical protein